MENDEMEKIHENEARENEFKGFRDRLRDLLASHSEEVAGILLDKLTNKLRMHVVNQPEPLTNRHKERDQLLDLQAQLEEGLKDSDPSKQKVAIAYALEQMLRTIDESNVPEAHGLSQKPR